jgi:chemotaxis protein histidine kinase CheA
MAAQQGLSSAEMREMLERRLAAIQPTVIDARSVNVDARSVVDSRTDARTVTIHNIADNRSVAQVVNVSGGPPPPPPGAGAIRGPTGPLPIQRWSPYPAPALADQLAITAGPPPPPPPPAIRARSATIEPATVKERARTRSPRRAPTNAERAAAKAAREEAKRAQAAEKERERLAKAAEKERLRQLKKIAREALVQDARRKLKRPKEFDISDGDPQRPRAPDPWLEPEEAAAAAEAAVKRRRVPKAKAKAQPKARAQTQPKARAQTRAQTPDVIRRVPVRERTPPRKAGPKSAPRRRALTAAAENLGVQ